MARGAGSGAFGGTSFESALPGSARSEVRSNSYGYRPAGGHRAFQEISSCGGHRCLRGFCDRRRITDRGGAPPNPSSFPREPQAVVETVGPTLPEFDGSRIQPITPPIGR